MIALESDSGWSYQATGINPIFLPIQIENLQMNFS